MENEISNQIGLTSSDNSPTLKGGDLFMADDNLEGAGGPPPEQQNPPEQSETQTPPEKPQGQDNGPREANNSNASASVRREQQDYSIARQQLEEAIATSATHLLTEDARERIKAYEASTKTKTDVEDMMMLLYPEQIKTRQDARDNIGTMYQQAIDRENAKDNAQGVVETLFKGNQELVAELMKDVPDVKKLDALSDFIEGSLEISNPQTAAFARIVTSPEGIHIRDSEGEIVDTVKLSPASRRLILEWTLEKIIGLPEKASPDSDYNIGSWYAQTNVDDLRSMSNSNFSAEEKAAHISENHRFVRYIGELIEMRKVAHEFRRSLSLGDSYKSIIQEHLKTHGLDFLNNEMAGVDKVLALYETFLGVKASEKQEWLEQSDITKVDKSVRDAMEKARDQGLLKKHNKLFSPEELAERLELSQRLKGPNNRLTDDKKKELERQLDEKYPHDRLLTEWEMDRALSIGKILTMGLQRQAIYTSLGQMPSGVAARLSSMPNEFMGRAIAPVKAYAERFFAGGADASYGGPRAFMRRLLTEIRREQGEETLFISKEKIDSWNTNGWGSVDPLSSKWRNELMFLADIKIGSGEDAETLMNLLESRLEDMRKKFPREIDRDDTHGYAMSKETKKDVKDELAKDEAMLAAVVGQRLYLSVLLRYDYLPEIAKQALFKKIAMLDPLKMAAFRPDVLDGLDRANKNIEIPDPENPGKTKKVTEKELWDSMSAKLALANMIRVEEDTKSYFTETSHGLHRESHSRDKLRVEASKLIDFSIAGKPQLKPDIDAETRYEILGMGEHGVFRTEAKNPDGTTVLNSDGTPKYVSILSDAEIAVLKKVIDAGVEMRKDSRSIAEHVAKNGLGEILRRGSVKTFVTKHGDMSKDVSISTLAAKAHMPFTFMLNDVPHVSWAKAEEGPSGISDEDMIRLFIFDGTGFQDAYEKALKPLIEQPNQEFRKHMKDFVDAIKNPDGEYNAQNKAAIVIQAWIRMASEYKLSGGFSELIRMYDVPRSEMEKYYPKSHLALNAAERGKYYDALAQDNTLSDARTRLFLGFIELKKSQLKRLKEATNSSRGKAMRDGLVGIMRLIAVALGINILATIFSKQTLKEAGLTE
jgi:predicted RNA-binding Zn ribbon-like protein